MKKRVVSIVLALVMIASMIPLSAISAFAGYDRSDDEGEIITGIFYTGISLTLGSDISINFYMELTEEAKNNGTMTFDIGGRTVTVGKTDAKYNAKEQKYYYSTPLTALEMAETVKATFSYNGLDYVQEYSVKEYICEIAENPVKYGEKAVALVKKIANYGYYAQLYLASIHSNVKIGDDGYAEMDKSEKDFDIKPQDAKDALGKYTLQVDDKSANLNLYGSTVYFDSATSLNYYVTVENGVEPSANAVNTVTGESKKVEIKFYKNNIYIVSVKNITAIELADDIEVTVDNGFTLSGSVFAYCNSVVKAHSGNIATAKDKFAVDAMAAFYEYYSAAVEYISFEVCFPTLENYKIFTADGKEEIQKDVTYKYYRPFKFRLVPDENYEIYTVFSEDDIEPDDNGLYTVSFIGGNHEVVIHVRPITVSFTVYLPCEDDGKITNTSVSFEYDNKSVKGSPYAPGKYTITVQKGASGTIVILKDGYEECRKKFTADGKTDEITVELTSSGSPD